MRNKIFQAQMNGMAFALLPSQMHALMEMANSEAPRAEDTTIEVAHNSVQYQTVNSIAVISVEGGMYKRDVGGLCSSVASYDKIVSYIDKAEADNAVDTILFRVDTGGGSVDGADEVGERIFNSSKKTITFYENTGASGGIWIFSASDEVYAAETTMLGSIGVVVSYMEENDTEGKRIDIVSKNAENKRCSLNGDCKEKIQSMLDSYEDIFFSRVMRNTGFSSQEIRENFNNGDMIFATKAKEDGFIKEVITFDKLMKSLKLSTGSTFDPTASVSENSTSNNSNEINEGAEMEFNIDNFNLLLESRAHLNGNIEALNAKLGETTTALEAKDGEIATLIAEHDSKLSEAVGKVDALKVDGLTRAQEAISYKVDADVIVNAIFAESAKEASKIILASKGTDGVTNQVSTEPVKSLWDDTKFNGGEK